MKRFKTLGIAVVAALALTAFAGAGTASANYFTAGAEPQAWNGALSGEKHSMYLGPFSTPYYCTGVAFSGETKSLANSDLRVSPQLGCEHIPGNPNGWKLNGCKFRFKPGPGPSLTGTMDIVGCTEPMRYEYWGCYSEIGNQNGLSKVEYENTTSGGVPALRVIAHITNLTYTNHENQCTGATNGTFSNGTYHGEWIVKGASVPGGSPAAAGIFAATVSSPRFAAEEGPATLSGESPGGALKSTFNFGANGVVNCIKNSYSGTALLVPTERITVTPSFHTCFIEGGLEYMLSDENLSAGGCSYQLFAKGGFNVVGTGCAASPITVTAPGCVFKVGPQTNAEGPTFTNQGSGKSRTVKVWNSPQKGFTYTAEGAGCVKTGTMTDGAVRTGGAVFSAKDPTGAAQGFWIE